MTNKERLTQHNAIIDQAIEKANLLPDAGGHTPPLCTATLSTKTGTYYCTVWDAELGISNVVTTTGGNQVVENVLRNSVIFFMLGGGIQGFIPNGVTQIGSKHAFIVNADSANCSIGTVNESPAPV